MKIKLSKIRVNPNQIRKISDDSELKELAESIRIHGLLQPIKVRPVKKDYELVYGHRRFSAMKLLNWEECDAIIDGITDEESLIQSIAENLQRQDLNVLDEANSYLALRDMGYSISNIAEIVKKPKGRISNRLSILTLPEKVQNLVIMKNSQQIPTTELGGLSADSASRIASSVKTASEATKIAKKAINEQLNTKEIRELTTKLKDTSNTSERLNIIKTPWAETKVQPRSNQFDTNNGSRISDSIGNQYHRKIIWNLNRINLGNYDHFTVGYSNRSIDQLIEVLLIAKVNTLVDVRMNPVSRFRPEFSKANLSSSLKSAGIDYQHIPELGIPSDIRKSKDQNKLFSWYEKNIDSLKIIKEQIDLNTQHRYAFLCVELDPDSCHRHCISQALEKSGFRFLDL